MEVWFTRKSCWHRCIRDCISYHFKLKTSMSVSVHEWQDWLLHGAGREGDEEGPRQCPQTNSSGLCGQRQGKYPVWSCKGWKIGLNFLWSFEGRAYNFQGGPLRCSWDLQCKEAEGWPCSLVAAGRGFLGLCNGCSQLGQVSLEQPELMPQTVCFKQELGPGGLQRFLAA